MWLCVWDAPVTDTQKSLAWRWSITSGWILLVRVHTCAECFLFPCGQWLCRAVLANWKQLNMNRVLNCKQLRKCTLQHNKYFRVKEQTVLTVIYVFNVPSTFVRPFISCIYLFQTWFNSWNSFILSYTKTMLYLDITLQPCVKRCRKKKHILIKLCPLSAIQLILQVGL